MITFKALQTGAAYTTSFCISRRATHRNFTSRSHHWTSHTSNRTTSCVMLREERTNSTTLPRREPECVDTQPTNLWASPDIGGTTKKRCRSYSTKAESCSQGREQFRDMFATSTR